MTFRLPRFDSHKKGIVGGARSAAVVTVVMIAAVVVTSCSFGREESSVAPVALEAYEPTAGLAAATATATDIGESGSASEGTNVDASLQPETARGMLGRYTAEIVPVDQVPLVPEAAGQVLEFNLEVGDEVNRGDLVLRVESSTYEAQRAQALAALQAAQAQLDLLTDGADERDIEAARAAVTAANEAYKRALEGPTAEDLTMAESQLRQAEAAVKQAQAAYDQVSWNPLIAALPESVQLESATLNLEAANAQYEKLVKGSTEDVIAGAYAQLASARAQLEALEEGPKPAQIEAAQAQVNQAETALYLAQLQLDKTVMRAPVDGIVASVNTAVGSMVAPGNPVAVLLSPDVEIAVAVEETRLPDLRLGQPATIRVDAYPGQEFPGEVAIIAPTLDPATRTVQVTIRPSGEAGALRPGMFATVELHD